eukprot:5664225-Prymnesium_polylepis.1
MLGIRGVRPPLSAIRAYELHDTACVTTPGLRPQRVRRVRMRHAHPRRWTGQSPRHGSRPRPATMLGTRGLRHAPRSVR